MAVRRVRRGAAASGAALGAGVLFAPVAGAETFEVLNSGDAGADTLRDAVAQANANPGLDEITFASSVTGTIALTSGALDVYDEVSIVGPGAGVLTISGSESSGIFYVGTPTSIGEGEPVSISGLTLTDGLATSGGAVRAEDAEVTIADSVLSGNRAVSRGGAVYSESGSLSIRRSTLSYNAATSGTAGAIFVERADDPAGNDDFALADSLVLENEAATAGAIYVDNTPTTANVDVVIERTTITGNDANGRGGGLVLDGPDAGSATISESTISGNASAVDEGGGIYVRGPEVPIEIESSTISGNAAEDGGGIYLQNFSDVEITLWNSTVVGNSAEENGGGIYRVAADDAAPGPDTVGLSSTIVANNVAAAGPDLFEEPDDVSGSFDVDFSMVEDTSGATVTESQFGTNLFGADPLLGPLGANGGPTLTHLPAPTSPVLDAGIANGLATDQRGLARTVEQPAIPDPSESDGTDIGAVELAAIPTAAPALGPCRGQKVAKTEGTAGDDEIIGSGDPDLIFGLAGDDNLSGVGAADCVDGGEGNDVIRGGGGGDRLRGGDGNDRIRGQNARDRISGGPGKDDLNGGGGKDRLSGGGGKDRIKGGPGKDKLKGGGGKDKLVATGSEPDKVNCGGGRDKARVDAEDRVSKNCERVVVVDD